MQNGFKYVPPHLRKEKARTDWDAQRKKQKKEEDQEESRRKLQPARKPFDNGVRLTGSCMEKNAVLRGLLSTDGSHPYKDVPYESGDHAMQCEKEEVRLNNHESDYARTDVQKEPSHSLTNNLIEKHSKDWNDTEHIIA
mmetsp:Transcript_21762/g.25137  ORF Transcript_21762/g.25137 Transcript_21762/m.25137 type:complete len:139 (+) Transcript_21762:303-719(+)